MFQFGFAREVITPAYGIPLCGYFNPRPNTGVLDDLFVRAALFEHDGIVGGLVVFDLCTLKLSLVRKIQAGIKAAGLEFGNHLIFSAIHTHTGPYVDDFLNVKPDAVYLNMLRHKTVAAVRQAYANLAPAELLVGSEKNNPAAFNRRYRMKNGRVLTNPGKCNPDIVRPEGTVDDEIGVLAVRQEGRIAAIVTNVVNHTDTIGGNLVSADWPGRMEKAIQESLGYDVPVLTLIGCSGDINHFDVTTDKDQCCYAEARRIGAVYAEIVTGILKTPNRLPGRQLRVTSSRIRIPYQVVSADDVKKAEAVLAEVGTASTAENMTSEGLAAGTGPVARFFAEQLIEFKQKCSGKSREFPMIGIQFDDQLALTSLPGEAFSEIGLEIKKRSPFPYTWPVNLAMGQCGYVALPECFSRGGYEILPVVGGGPAPDTAGRLVEAALKNLNLPEKKRNCRSTSMNQRESLK